jgi:integrase
MTKHNAANERIKREYFSYLRDAKGRDEATIDGVAKSLARFEESTRRKEFKRLHRGQAIAFKEQLAATRNARTGERLSKATMLATLRNLREFFFWLAHQPGFKSHIRYGDADYFNLSEKDMAIAKARREKLVPTLRQAEHVLAAMPADTQIQRRDRALIALAVVTGARIAALTSFRVRHINMGEGFVEQDAREVHTKFGKTFRTTFMPFSELALSFVRDWHSELIGDPTRGPDDPLFPSTEIGLDEGGSFAPTGLARRGWSTTASARDVFRRAFARAGLNYFNPHSFRDMLVQHAMGLELSPELMKALSQNLGHADVLTTFTSYGTIPAARQAELIRSLGRKTPKPLMDDRALIDALAARLRGGDPGRSGFFVDGPAIDPDGRSG